MRNIQTKLDSIINMIKELDDYLDILQNKYPHISRYELKRVLEHGFYTFYILNRKGADVHVHNNRFTALCGRMFIDDRIRYLYNCFRKKRKLHLTYNYAQEKYDGAYYFGLSDEEWDRYKKKIMSPQKKKIKFTNLKLYKIKDECYIDKTKTHFLMAYYPIDVGWSFTEEELTTKDFKYFAYRDAKGQIVTI